LGTSTFLDPDSGADDEKLVIFGGQSIESEAYTRLMNTVNEGKHDPDLTAEKDHW